MKYGQKVAVCHDGKWGRRVQGEVVGTRRGHHIKIRFNSPVDDKPVEFWARKLPTIHYMRNKPGSCIYYSKRYAYFAGWADIDWFSPWFSVYKWKDESVEA